VRRPLLAARDGRSTTDLVGVVLVVLAGACALGALLAEDLRARNGDISLERRRRARE